MPAVEVKAARGIERAQLDELPGGDVERAQQRVPALERDVAAHPDRVAPGADDVAGPAHRRGQPAERLLPLVAPDLEVDVDDVVVGDREAAQPVVDAERALLVAVRLEPPDDARAAAEIARRRTCPAGRRARARSRRPGGYAAARSPRRRRSSSRSPERSGISRKPYVNEPENATVISSSTATTPSGPDVDLDVARDERVGLGLGDACEAERGDDDRRERERR